MITKPTDSWKEKQARAAMMDQTMPAGRRTIEFGARRCVKCNTTFTAAFIESTGRALLVGGRIEQQVKMLRFFCFTCNWAGTPEDAQRWLTEHPATTEIAKAPEESADASV